jgi:hypothetical protein
MIRKTFIAIAAVAAVGAAALVPTTASAHHFGGGWRHGGWYHWNYGGYNNCVRYVPRPWGFQRVNVCRWY